jgi:cytochrome c553
VNQTSERSTEADGTSSIEMMTGPDWQQVQAIAVNVRREAGIMKGIILPLALPVAILVIAFSGTGRAGDTDARVFANYNVGGKMGYCTDCHGSSGRGYVGFFTMPRLAGQSTEYLVKQLRAFAERRRGNNLPMRMARVHGLSPSTRSALAAHFSHLNPSPFGRAPRELVATGKRIYDDGIPGANVPACSACHGADAKGNGAEIPRLAGQLYGYTLKALANWGDERGQSAGDPSNIMKKVAHNMSRSQSAAVAAYLSYQK